MTSATVAGFLGAPRPMLIGDDWTMSSSRALAEIFDPSTGQVIGHVAAGDAADADRAAREARAAFDDKRWRGMTPAAREKIIWRIAELMEQHADVLAELEMLDTGKPLRIARDNEVPFAAECMRYYAGWCTKIEGVTKIISTLPPDAAHVYTRREPVGAVALILPFNGPLVQACWKLGPALAAGCSCVLKPDEKTPLSTLRLGELILEAGVPPGVVNIVTGDGPSVGAALVRHPSISKVSFTGSTEVGQQIAAAAGQNLKKLTLELGGKSPVIVLGDADLDQAIPGIAQGIFANAGQVCVAGSRLYVDENIHDAVIDGIAAIARDLKVGPGTDPDAEMGPLISAAHRERVSRLVDGGRQQGADIVTGGQPLELGGGYFFAPTVLANATADMQVVREEIFGPVLAVQKLGPTDEIVSSANDSRYGLAASIWTRDVSMAHRLAAEIEAGLVWINCHGIPDMAVPFGGYKDSGWGRENGWEGLLEYTEHKSVITLL